MPLETRRQFRAGIAAWALRVSCLLAVAGTAASFTVVFLAAGIALLALAAATLIVGLASSLLAPLAVKTQPLSCPLCGTVSRVSRGRQWWHCDGCRQVIVRARNGKSLGVRTALTR